MALASSLSVGVGTVLPWQVVRFEGARRSFPGWDLSVGDAAVCVVLAALGVVAAWSLTAVRGLGAALVGRLALLAVGGAALGLTGLQAVELGDRLDLPGLSTRPGVGLVVVAVGGLGLVGAGAWAAWRPEPHVAGVPGAGC